MHVTHTQFSIETLAGVNIDSKQPTLSPGIERTPRFSPCLKSTDTMMQLADGIGRENNGVGDGGHAELVGESFEYLAHAGFVDMPHAVNAFDDEALAQDVGADHQCSEACGCSTMVVWGLKGMASRTRMVTA